MTKDKFLISVLPSIVGILVGPVPVLALILFLVYLTQRNEELQGIVLFFGLIGFIPACMYLFGFGFSKIRFFFLKRAYERLEERIKFNEYKADLEGNYKKQYTDFWSIYKSFLDNQTKSTDILVPAMELYARKYYIFKSNLDEEDSL